MKSNRHSKILQLISEYPIDTQEGLLAHLKAEGFQVTQATVSRDIRELGIHKIRGENGKYYYVSGQLGQEKGMSGKFATIFAESVRTIDYAQNIVVIKCFTGMANAACATFDAADFSEVVGTLSGDDTFFVVTRSEESARLITEQLLRLLNR
ncbi:MAG: arginine repressor [Oscillospiraceae bacterium]|nr:MAG: arginine repressor [Oscillospiraceae bacterium]